MERIIFHKLLSFIESMALFGLVFGVVLSVAYRNVMKGALLGLFAGILFGLGILLYNLLQEKEARDIYNRISGQGEEIIYYTLANMFTGKTSAGGRIYITAAAIRFKELGPFKKGNNIYISLASVEDVALIDKPNCIAVLTRNGTTTIFAVHERKKVQELIVKGAAIARKKYIATAVTG